MRPAPPSGPFLVVGLARSGEAAAQALHARGEQVVCYDAREREPAAAKLRALGIEVTVGGAGVELLDGVGCLVKSPGVPREAAVIAAALERGITVLGELELAWRMLPNEIVVVTGTNGKTTTVELIGAIHREAGLPVEVAGNVGRALSLLVPDPPVSEATIVCEASSFQLEDTLELAPEAAVLLNLEPDHLDRHRTFERYKAAKLRAFTHQRHGAIAVLPEALAQLEIGGEAERLLFGAGEGCDLRLLGGVLHWHGEPLVALAELRMRAPVEDAMAAAAVSLARGVPPSAVHDALVAFRGVTHRLEEVAHVDDVTYVNDSKATNVASTLVALAAFPAGSVLLILGGQGKSQDFTPLRAAVAERVAHTYLIGEDADTIARALDGLELTHAETLVRALGLARVAARPGMVVLLSPACASFDQFSDFEARGDAFRELVIAGLSRGQA